VVRLVADACRAEGLKLALYYSVWDRHEPTYGRSPEGYTSFMKGQLRELLTNYGDIIELWFDGSWDQWSVANLDLGELYAYVHSLQPECLVYEHGNLWPYDTQTAGEFALPPERNTNLVERDGQGYFLPTEVCWTLRDNVWFYHTDVPATAVRSADEAYGIWEITIARRGVLAMDVGPDRRGLIPPEEVAVLQQVGEMIRNPVPNLAEGATVTASSQWSDEYAAAMACDGDLNTRWGGKPGSAGGEWLELDLGRPREFSRIGLYEYAQRVQAYRLEYLDGAEWKTLAEGTTIGLRHVDRFDPVTAQKLRLSIREATDVPSIYEIKVEMAGR